jgi:hypothetical protein
MKKVLQVTFYCLLSLAASAQPISLHPDNPHYFRFKGIPLIIISSSEHYGAVVNPDFNMIRYLDALQKDGMTYTRLFTGTYFEKAGSFGIQMNTLAPEEGKALLPWKRSNEPGALSGGNKFDLDEWDENYFLRLKRFISEASKRGIIVEVTLFSSIYDNWDIQVWNPKNNITITEDFGRKNIQTLNNGIALKYQESVVRKIVKELNEFDNVIYEIQNEPWADHTARTVPNVLFNDPGSRLEGRDWQKSIHIPDELSIEWQKKITSVIVDEESTLNKKHLIARNYTNFYYKILKVDPDISILNFHYAYPLAVELNYNHEKVIGFDESGFSGNEDATYRKQAWKFIVAGGGLYNNLDYSFAVGFEDGSAVNKAPGGGSHELRNQLKVLSDFMHSFEFVRMKPDYNTVTEASGSTVSVLSEQGQQYAFYLSDGKRCELKLNLPKGNYMVEWISTLQGEVIRSEIIRHTGTEIKLLSPDFLDDIALKIKRQ